MAFALDYALKTHPGLVRPLNEDAIGADPSVGLFILADGLGGYNAGEIASTMTVSTLLMDLTAALSGAQASGLPFDPHRVLVEALAKMNNDIFRAAMNSSAFEGMATTVVVAWLLGDRLWVAHTGDSRLYRQRGGNLEQLTRDHSFSQELLDAGMVTEEEARVLPAKNLVTRALGAAADVEPEVHNYDVALDDVLLLCSDGLTEMITHYEIAGLLTACLPNLAEAARRLVNLANEAGGRDNTSVVLVRVTTPGSVHGASAAADEELEEPAELSDRIHEPVEATMMDGADAGGGEQGVQGHHRNPSAGAVCLPRVEADWAGNPVDTPFGNRPGALAESAR
jgi:protein phosphatase